MSPYMVGKSSVNRTTTLALTYFQLSLHDMIHTHYIYIYAMHIVMLLFVLLIYLLVYLF